MCVHQKVMSERRILGAGILESLEKPSLGKAGKEAKAIYNVVLNFAQCFSEGCPCSPSTLGHFFDSPPPVASGLLRALSSSSRPSRLLLSVTIFLPKTPQGFSSVHCIWHSNDLSLGIQQPSPSITWHHPRGNCLLNLPAKLAVLLLISCVVSLINN